MKKEDASQIMKFIWEQIFPFLSMYSILKSDFFAKLCYYILLYINQCFPNYMQYCSTFLITISRLTECITRRRYSDFEWLRNEIERAVPIHIPELPPKVVMGSGTWNQDHKTLPEIIGAFITHWPRPDPISYSSGLAQLFFAHLAL